MLAADAFRFLNVIGHVRKAVDWNDPAREKLWLYNLHYFDDLNALVAAAERTAWQRALLIERWVAENPPGAGNGWEPYPTSLRSVNWIKWGWPGMRCSLFGLRAWRCRRGGCDDISSGICWVTTCL
jgi:hypothetical protein